MVLTRFILMELAYAHYNNNSSFHYNKLLTLTETANNITLENVY